MSARSTTSVFACGMSIPDSMIVVETSTSASPRRKECIRSSSSFSRIWPCATRKRSPGQSCCSCAARSSIVSTRLWRKNAWPSRPASRSSASFTSSSSYSPTVVRIGRRPSGGVSMIEMSRIPASDRWRVRGIGVALSVSTSTSSRSDLSSSFCATPNRCSSSRITSPSSFGITSRLRIRCVPTRTSTLPALKSARIRFVSFGGDEPGDHLDAHREVAEALAERVEVLLGEDRGGREEQHLPAVHRDGERGAHRDLRLAEADVAADEPVHRPRRLEVLLHRLDRSLLVGRLAIGEARLELRQPLAREVVRDALARLALRVELDQVAGELADRLARTRLERLPGLAAELRERRRRGVGADVARDLPELLVRDVEPILPAEREQEVVARDAGDGLRLEPEQSADAVILVHDVVAGAEVGEGLQRPAAETALARRAAAEDLVVGQQDEAELAPDEAAARRRHGEEKLGLLRKLVPRLQHPGLDPAEEVLGAQRLAAMREGDDDALARAKERCELALGLGEAAGGDRRPLRLEREGLSLRERVELGRPRERGRLRGCRPPPRRDARRPAGRRGRAAGRAAARGRREPAARRGSSPSSASNRLLLSSTVSGRRSAAGYRVASATGWSARCVKGEKARTDSISSPKNSTRNGSRPVVGKTSTMPPRTANWPRSSTRSTRS